MRNVFNRYFPMVVRIGIFVAVLGSVSAEFASAQAPTPKQKQAVNQIKSSIDRASKQFKAKKMAQSSQWINQAIQQVDTLAAAGVSAELLELIQPQYDRLAKAHQLLSDAGEELDELKPLPPPMTGDEPKVSVSFTKSVAPILVAKCGNCHVNRNRGDFSAATFEALDLSTMLAYGNADDARLIQVIESGEMPKGGGSVDEAELKVLRAWIAQGAKFDGANVKQSLNEFVTAPSTPGRNRLMTANLPTGKETVSFGLDVAPILLENCGRCHINDNPRGNFSMVDFRRLLRGGDGGAPFEPGNPSASQIIKRLRGDGVDVMPPSGKLDDALIEVIVKWIQEGAAYDGGDVQLGTEVVAAVLKADSQTHEALVEDRAVKAAETWKLVMDGVESTTLASEHFLVTGSTNESRLTDVSRICEKLAPKIASALRASSKQPLVKGNVSVFVFDKRYDFSEFGKMIEKRDFPKELSGHWGFTTIDAYATVLMTRNQDADDVQVELAHQIASLHVASLAPDMPRWFADGVGLWTAKKILSKEDAMKSLESRAETAAASMVSPDDFVQNRMPSDRAALVGYLFVKRLRSEAGTFSKLMSQIQKQRSFEAAFKDVYKGSPSELLGQQKKRARSSR